MSAYRYLLSFFFLVLCYSHLGAQDCNSGCRNLGGSTIFYRHPSVDCKAIFEASYTIGANDSCAAYNFVVTSQQTLLLASDSCEVLVLNNTPGSKLLRIKCRMSVHDAVNSLFIDEAFCVVKGTDTCLYPIDEVFEKTLPTATITADSCGSDKNTGKISVSAMTGSTISWRPSAGGSCYPSPAQCWIYRQLPAEQYELTVTDTFGCKTVDTLTVPDLSPNATVVAYPIVNPVCWSDTTTLRVKVSWQGSPPSDYDYYWVSYQTGDTINTDTSLPDADTLLSHLRAGLYFFHIRIPASSCVLKQGFYVHAPPPIEVSGTVVEPSCATDSTGQIMLAVRGGRTPASYTYSWDTGNPGDTTAMLTGLVQGTYKVTVTNQDGCVGIGIFDLAAPNAIGTEILTINSVLCHGDSTGQIMVDPSGGVPYRVETGRFMWFVSYGQEGYDFKLYRDHVLVDSVNKQRRWIADSLKVGSYVLEVWDSVGCSFRDSITIVEPSVLRDTLILLDEVECADPCSGKLRGQGTGGTPPYWYTILQKDLNGNFRQYIKGQAYGPYIEVNRLAGYGPGIFQLELSDAHDCIALSNTITIPDTGRDYHPGDLNPCVECQTCDENQEENGGEY